MKKFLMIYFASLYATFGQTNSIYNQISGITETQATLIIKSPFAISPNQTSEGFALNISNTAIQLSADTNILNDIERTKPVLLSLEMPVSTKKKIKLTLIPIDIYGPTYQVKNAKDEILNLRMGVFYKGIIDGDDKSLVSINIINGELSGFVSNKEANFTIGKLKNNQNYIFYNNQDLSEKPNLNCFFTDNNLKKINSPSINYSNTLSQVTCPAAQIYVELDNNAYISNGSNMISATNYVNNLIAQVAVLYNNEGLNIQISELKIWNTLDPYSTATNTNDAYDLFGNILNSTFNGDLAHLLSTRGLGGGVGGIDVLCSKGFAVSGNLSTYITPLPVFSWNTFVIAHELGHNFGSPHTQNCSWPGGAIDNCGSIEGTCTNSPGPPPNGGTIMSYCHQNSVGINFSNGFGALPGALIRKRAQECLGSTMAILNPEIIYIYDTKALLKWDYSFNTKFWVEYKAENSTNWLIDSTFEKYIELKNLIPNTKYFWRVKTTCSLNNSSVFNTNTISSPNYCKPTFSIGCNSVFGGIKDVIIGGINYNNNSGCNTVNGYDFNFKNTQTLIPGNTYTSEIRMTDSLAILFVGGWIDYNKNGSFEPTEKFFDSNNASINATETIISSSFTVPNSTLPVYKTRMRVMKAFNPLSPDGCTDEVIGESEDFFINIGTCFPLLALSNPTDNLNTGSVIQQASALNGRIVANNLISGIGVRSGFFSKSIILNPGFKVDNGAVFTANVGGCN
jgi:Metallo-peptidase family M12/GEVED domain